jgi:hypothetical protein
VDDVLVVEAADDVEDRVGLADVGEELVAEALALGRALHEPGDVDELDGRRHDGLRVDDRLELVEARIRDDDDARIGLDRAERIVLRLDSRRREGVEESALPDVREADDAASESHGRRMFPNSRASVMSSAGKRPEGPGCGLRRSETAF